MRDMPVANTPLNSNLILLIPERNTGYDPESCFKFQSDSINTRVQRHL